LVFFLLSCPYQTAMAGAFNMYLFIYISVKFVVISMYLTSLFFTDYFPTYGLLYNSKKKGMVPIIPMFEKSILMLD